MSACNHKNCNKGCQEKLSRINENLKSDNVSFVYVQDKEIPFIYTVGLAPKYGCELIISGCMNPQMYASIMNGIISGLQQDKNLYRKYKLLEVGFQDKKVEVRVSVACAEVSEHHRKESMYQAYSRFGDFVGVQILIPDGDMNHPGDENYDDRAPQEDFSVGVWSRFA